MSTCHATRPSAPATSRPIVLQLTLCSRMIMLMPRERSPAYSLRRTYIKGMIGSSTLSCPVDLADG
eukprot:68332-Prorocentrum_lima.AAC.1